MRIVFMGTPEFAIPSLRILLDHHYQVVAVVTVPDAPSGRGQKMTSSAVKRFAMARDLPVLQPGSLKEPDFQHQLRSFSPDLFVVVAFRILPRDVFSIPRNGAFNLHASLLPKYRGAAPIQWAVINGEKETGVTTFFLEEKVDTGNMILQMKIPIGENDTAGEMHDKLAMLGATVVLETVQMIEQGKALPQAQDNSLASPAPKIFNEQCRIDWQKPARKVHDFIRGLSPKPGAWTHHDGTLLKLYRSRLDDMNVPPGEPGTVLDVPGRFIVQTGNGVVEITELQQEGKKLLSAHEFLRGYPIKAGDRL